MTGRGGPPIAIVLPVEVDVCVVCSRKRANTLGNLSRRLLHVGTIFVNFDQKMSGIGVEFLNTTGTYLLYANTQGLAHPLHLGRSSRRTRQLILNKQGRSTMAKARVETAKEPSMTDLMSMITAQQAQMNTLTQALAAILPGSATMTSVKANKPEPAKQDRATFGVNLEAFTDRRVPYIGLLTKAQTGTRVRPDGVGIDFCDGKGHAIHTNRKTTDWKGGKENSIVTQKLAGQFALGAVFERREGSGLDWLCLTEKGTISIDHDKAIQLVQDANYPY